MYKLIGNKESFAVEIEILRIEEFNKQCWIKSRFWVGGSPIGLFDEDENYLGPFLKSLRIVSEESEQFWDDELEGLNCRETFLFINPFIDNFEAYTKLSREDAKYYDEIEGRYRFMWGENFDGWMLNVVIKDGICMFLWFLFRNPDGSENEDYNTVQCFKVPLSEVQDAYREVYAMIPDEYWKRFKV